MSGQLDLGDKPSAKLLAGPGHGFVEMYPDSPYSIDPRVIGRTEMTGARLAEWLSADYAATSDEARARYVASRVRVHGSQYLNSALRELPYDMEQIVRQLALHTGGEFLLMGVWNDVGSTPKYFE